MNMDIGSISVAEAIRLLKEVPLEDRPRKRLRGLSENQYKRLRDKAGGICQLCGCPAVKLVLDHNHQTGAPRAFVCDSCNHAIGRVEMILREMSVQELMDYLALDIRGQV